MAKSRRNPRYYGPGKRAGRERVLRLVRERAANGEPCALCGQPIDLSLPQWEIRNGRRWRTPWSLECDEIVPVSRGGSPTDPNNVQPTHRICNQKKGAGRAVSFNIGRKGDDNGLFVTPHTEIDGETAGRW